MVEVLVAHNSLGGTTLLISEAGGVSKLVVGVVLERAGHGVGRGASVLTVGGRDGELPSGRSSADGLVRAVHATNPHGVARLVGDEARALAKGVSEGDGLGAAVEGLAKLGGRLVVSAKVDSPVHAGAAGVGVGSPLGESPLPVMRAHNALAVGRGDLSHDTVCGHGRRARVEDLACDHKGVPGAAEVGVALRAEDVDLAAEGAGDVVAAQLAGADLDDLTGDGHGERLGLARAKG